MEVKDSSQFEKRSSVPSRLTWTLAGVVFGTTVGYFFDPVRGTYRRNVLRDRAMRWTRDAEALSLRIYRDLENRLQGAIYRFQHPLSQDVDDQTLESRIRSEFGRKVRHPKSIHTQVREGVVTLSGVILTSEVRSLIRGVRSMPGVKSVINNLEVKPNSDHIPGLQGEGKQYLQ